MNRAPARRCALLLVILAPVAAWGADKSLDAGLLEFLGSLDAEGSGWSEYLESADLSEAAKRAKPVKPHKPAVPAPAPAVPPGLAAAPPARQPENPK